MSWNNFFNDNPEKVLGEVKTVKGKFGEVTITEGDVTKLKDIKVPQYKVVLPENPTQSEEVLDVKPETISSDQAKTLKKVEKKSKQRKSDIQINKGNKGVVLWDFDEVDELYNEGISEGDKKAFVFYLEQLTGKSVEGGFAKYSGNNAEQLLEEGVLFYDIKAPSNRAYQPRFLFASGNIYKKRKAILADKEIYLNMFSESVYQNHVDALEEAYEEIRSRALTLDNPDEKLRLKILPTSKIAKTFVINQIISPKTKEKVSQFSVYVSNTKDGQVYDMTKTPSRSGNYGSVSSYNLRDAFILWLKDAGDPTSSRNYGIIYRNGMSFPQIYSIYIKGMVKAPSGLTADRWLRMKTTARLNGDRLFAQFLAEGLTTEDRRLLELMWNEDYNATVNYNVNKVPIGFQFAKFFGESLNDIRPEKREAIGFTLVRGSSCLAYGVGIGKTWCGIFTLAQNLELGLAKRPLVIVPNQVYPQFLKEIRNILPQYDINGLYNMRGYYKDLAYQVEDRSISICTYEGLKVMGFSDNLDAKFITRISDILESTDAKISERHRAKQEEKYEEMLGVAKAGTVVEIDDPRINFDYVICDEAHNMKKLFTSVKGETKYLTEQQEEKIEKAEKLGKVPRETTPYSLNSGVPSSQAKKLFFLTQYVQMNNPNGNCCLLTATPFTNSPLEVYSMLSMINYNYLVDLGFKEMASFFDVFADIQTELVINTLLKPIRKQVFKGWRNVIGLQDLVFKFIDKKGREDEDKLVTRPNKIILPLKNKMVDGVSIPISEKNHISTTLKLSSLQVSLMARIKTYAEGDMDFRDEGEDGFVAEDALCNDEWLNTTSFGKLVETDKSELADGEGEVEIKKFKPNDDNPESKYESAGVRALQCLAYSRQLALTPYLFNCSGLTEEPTPEEFVESSPKLMYVVECIRTVKNYHNKTNTPMSGQVIYMDIGTQAFPLIASYIVSELSLSKNEVGFITGSKCKIGNKNTTKDKVQDAFLGRKFNEDTKDFEEISDSERLKVLIGSSSIREGMNLQNYGTVLYNCYLDFNPTDNIQLEGRIWRQGNNYANVRIVMPMMEDSMDIFMFQKLEEKTERINQLWVQDGMTNEIDTTSFDPAELKYELITDPFTLAQLKVEDEEKKIDEQIDDINYEFSSFNNFTPIYKTVDILYEAYYEISSYLWEDSRVGRMYYFLRCWRPDLVPLNLFKDAYYRDVNNPKTWRGQEYSQLSDTLRTRTFKDEWLNYTPEMLIEKMVEFNRDRKVAYPIGYTTNWRDNKAVDENDNAAYEVGDVVTFTTRRGKKQGKIIEKFAYDDFDIELDNGLVLENVDPDSYEDFKKVVEEVEKELVTEVLEPFNWGTDKAAAIIFDINQYQRQFQTTDNNLLEGFANEMTPVTIIDYTNAGYDPRNNKEDWILYYNEEIKKWTFLTDQFKEARSSVKGWAMAGGKKFYDTEYALIFKKLKKGEEEFLQPKGIRNRAELEAKISELKANMLELEQSKSNLTSEESLSVMAAEISEQLEEKRNSGLRKPSTVKSRVAEFAVGNADYLGNDYLSLLTPKKKKKKKKVKVVEEVVEVPTEAPKQVKVVEQINEQVSEKKEVEQVEAELTANDINELIEGLELGLEYLDGQDLEDAKEQIEGLKITLDYI